MLPPNGYTKHEVISKEVLESIRTLSPIEHIIGEHVQLRHSGSNQLLGRCCFHTDKTPSLSVSINKQVFHCHGCHAGGDVFEFVRRLFGCSFTMAVQGLAERAGVNLDRFVPSPELKAKVAAVQTQRAKEMAFERFCDERIAAVNQRHRDLGRAATHAENCLRAGESDPHVHELAWDALERFRLFEARIEREGLVDLDVLRSEWKACGGVGHAAA